MTNIAIEIAKVRANIRNCTNCELFKTCSSPVPFSGDVPNDIVIIGEAPGVDEDRQNKPFVGRSGLLLRKYCRDFGLRPSFVNAVSCFPHRTPLPGEILSCRGNLLSQLQLIKPKFALVVGAIPTSSFWPTIEFKYIRGTFWQAVYTEGKEFAWAMSTYHPAAILRNPDLESSVLNHFYEFSKVVQGKEKVELKDECLMCGGEVERELYGLGFCMIHWTRMVKKGWGRKTRDVQVQGSML